MVIRSRPKQSGFICITGPLFLTQKRSENSEYCPLCSGPAHWIPACAGMTEYGLYRGSTRPKAGFQIADQSALVPLRLVDDIEHWLALEVALQLGAEELIDFARSVL